MTSASEEARAQGNKLYESLTDDIDFFTFKNRFNKTFKN